MVIAFAMKYLKMPLANAYQLLCDRIQKVSMNEGFKHQVMEYEKKLFKTNSINFFDKTARRLSAQKSPSFVDYFSDQSDKKRVTQLQKTSPNTSVVSPSRNSPTLTSLNNKSTPYRSP